MNKILRQKKNHFNFSTIIEDVSINDSFQLVQKSKPIIVTVQNIETYVSCTVDIIYTVEMFVDSNTFNQLISYQNYTCINMFDNYSYYQITYYFTET